MLLSYLKKMMRLRLGALFVAFLVPLSVVVAGDDSVSMQSALQGCHACHSERVPSLQQSDKCLSCHDEDMSLKSSLSLNSMADHHHVLPSKQADLPPGMSVPMRYSDSRFGAEPGSMVSIPAGVFAMGSDTRLEDEGPQHQARSGAYSIDIYEVTNLQYRRFIAATQRRSPRHFRNRTFPEGKADHPVTQVSWFDAKAYCHWAGKRLPTEIEWEKAARGDDARVYPWGNEFELQAANTPVRWVELRKAGLAADGDTTPVGAFAAGRSPYGLFDMSGNVWEWVADWYGPHPGNAGVSENYGQINKVLKGGSWWDCSFYKCGISAPTFNRSFFSPRVRNSSFGFRCAKDAGGD